MTDRLPIPASAASKAPDGWLDAWENSKTPWDAGASPPELNRLVELDLLPHGPTLVPGCGHGYDVMTLAQRGNPVTGLDLSPLAADHFETLRDASDSVGTKADVESADFFSWSKGPYALIWDYTFRCALEPASMPDWSRKMAELVRPGGQLVVLIFPVGGARMNEGGPPYPQEPEEVARSLADDFTPLGLTQVTRSHPGRQGKEWLGRFERNRL